VVAEALAKATRIGFSFSGSPSLKLRRPGIRIKKKLIDIGSCLVFRILDGFLRIIGYNKKLTGHWSFWIWIMIDIVSINFCNKTTAAGTAAQEQNCCFFELWYLPLRFVNLRSVMRNYTCWGLKKIRGRIEIQPRLKSNIL
jgi:hypothetical protein